MTTLRVGIMPSEEFQKRTLDIISGKYKPKRGEPKVWFSSMKSLSEVLSDNNLRLLKLIETHHPETLKDMAVLSGRRESNLSRTLKTMERYGIVKLERRAKTIHPIAKATSFDIRYGM